MIVGNIVVAMKTEHSFWTWSDKRHQDEMVNQDTLVRMTGATQRNS